MIDFKEILSVSLISISVIVWLGSNTDVINLRKKVGHNSVPKRQSLACPGSYDCVLVWLENQSSIFWYWSRRTCLSRSIDHFCDRAEMILGIEIFKAILKLLLPQEPRSFPIAFPWSLGAGTWLLFWHGKQELSRVNIASGFVEFESCL